MAAGSGAGGGENEGSDGDREAEETGTWSLRPGSRRSPGPIRPLSHSGPAPPGHSVSPLRAQRGGLLTAFEAACPGRNGLALEKVFRALSHFWMSASHESIPYFTQPSPSVLRVCSPPSYSSLVLSPNPVTRAPSPRHTSQLTFDGVLPGWGGSKRGGSLMVCLHHIISAGVSAPVGVTKGACHLRADHTPRFFANGFSELF